VGIRSPESEMEEEMVVYRQARRQGIRRTSESQYVATVPVGCARVRYRENKPLFRTELER
jgi:hypothetical protein